MVAHLQLTFEQVAADLETIVGQFGIAQVALIHVKRGHGNSAAFRPHWTQRVRARLEQMLPIAERLTHLRRARSIPGAGHSPQSLALRSEPRPLGNSRGLFHARTLSATKSPNG